MSIQFGLKTGCDSDVQKLLGKVNYLCRFIVNLTGKVDSFFAIDTTQT
jgi:hypothetical protein